MFYRSIVPDLLSIIQYDKNKVVILLWHMFQVLLVGRDIDMFLIGYLGFIN